MTKSQTCEVASGNPSFEKMHIVLPSHKLTATLHLSWHFYTSLQVFNTVLEGAATIGQANEISNKFTRTIWNAHREASH